MVFKLCLSAQNRWRSLNGSQLLEDVVWKDWHTF